jgi:CubicO group peptidase (beta-lactamase class C family)
LHAYLATLTKRHGSHGSEFRYISANTDAMGWVLERAAHTDYADLMSQELWSKLGAERDAYVLLDGFQAPYTDPGLNMTLRDLGRFAQMVLQRGLYNGQQIVPGDWIEDIRHGGDQYDVEYAGAIAIGDALSAPGTVAADEEARGHKPARDIALFGINRRTDRTRCVQLSGRVSKD